jgi:hypothetical protein
MLPFDLGGVIRIMDENPQYGASYSRKFLFNNKGLTGEVHGGALSDFNAFFAPKININAMVIRAEVLAAHGYFKPVPNSAINDDVFLMIRLGADCEYHFDEANPRLLYRVHDKQNSRLFHHEDQNPYRWMAAYMTEQQPALYERILANDPPKLTKNNRRWVLGLMGAALFLRQHEHSLVLPITEKACEIAPDDYGAWEHRILVLAMMKRHDEIMDVFQSAVERFKGQSPTKEIQLISAMSKYYRSIRKQLPDAMMKRYTDLMTQNSTPPKIVVDALQTVMK